jgi:D-3-phosphoglycerate dehydrogenase / 2-oxoglutarate reductase
MRRICHAGAAMRRGDWLREEHRGSELTGRTIGIIGFGHTGSAFAAKFAGWGVRILAYDKYKTGYAQELPYVEETTLDNLVAQAEMISFHVPLTEETTYMADAGFFTRCRPGTIVINSARGKVVDTRALVDALSDGHLGGACLDVFGNEKPQTYSPDEETLYNALFAMPNVVITPHIAGWTHESKARIALQMVHEITALQDKL